MRRRIGAHAAAGHCGPVVCGRHRGRAGRLKRSQRRDERPTADAEGRGRDAHRANRARLARVDRLGDCVPFGRGEGTRRGHSRRVLRHRRCFRQRRANCSAASPRHSVTPHCATLRPNLRRPRPTSPTLNPRKRVSRRGSRTRKTRSASRSSTTPCLRCSRARQRGRRRAQPLMAVEEHRQTVRAAVKDVECARVAYRRPSEPRAVLQRAVKANRERAHLAELR